MVKRILTIFTLWLAILWQGFVFGEVVDKIVVIVNNEVITQREIDRILEPIYEQYRGAYPEDELIKKLDAARTQVINQLIDDRLLLSEAKKQNIEVDEKDISSRIEETARNFKSRDMFEKALLSQNISLADLKQRYREQLMVRRLIDSRIGSGITVSPVEVGSYYREHTGDFVQPEQIKLSNILIRPNKNMNSSQAERRAKDILFRLKEGCDFAGLAREYSEGPGAADGGMMGYVTRGDLLPEIEAAVFSMKEGETSGIIQTNLGYHIFKVEERRARKTRELKEVERDVEEAIFREKVKGKIKGWLGDLKKNAYIAFK